MESVFMSCADQNRSTGHYRILFIGTFFITILFAITPQTMAAIWLKGKTAPVVSGNSYYGYSIDIDGNYAIVGAYLHDVDYGGPSLSDVGRVWILEKTNGAWTDSNYLELERDDPGNEYDEFGRSVAISGNYAVVGAPGQRSGSIQGTGAIYVFYKNGDSWDEMQQIRAFTTKEDAQFGHTVDIYENYLIVGTPHKHTVHFYELVGDSWTLKDARTVSGIFGTSVAISNGYAIVGDPSDDTHGDYAGAAYIFKRNDSTGRWAQQTPLLYPNGDWSPQTYDRFGISVSIDGDYAIIGANPPDKIGDEYLLLQGSAYIFKRDDNETWTQHSTYLYDEEDSDPGGNNFGGSVSINGRYAVVGASGDNEQGTNAGAAFFFI